MKQKLVRVPFEVNLAKEISNGTKEGKVVTRDDRNARIICWDAEGDHPIIALIKYYDKEYPYSFCMNGLSQDGDYLNVDLMLEIPEYMTFKDGDVYKTEKGSVAIYNGNYQATMNNTPYYVGLRECDGNLIFQSNCYGFGIIQKCTLDVTKEEKQKLIDALKASKEPKAKDCLKMLGIEVKPEYEFKFRDVVLVRSSNKDKWCSAEFSNKDGKWYAVFGGLYYERCIPYNEQTAHLLGTTDNLEE